MENDKYACLDWDTPDLLIYFTFFVKKMKERTLKNMTSLKICYPTFLPPKFLGEIPELGTLLKYIEN